MLCGDDSYAFGESGNAQFTLQVEHTLFLQLTDNLLTLAGHIAEGIGGVYVADNPRKSVGFVKLGIDAQQHLHAGTQLLPGGAFEIGLDHHPRLPPTFGRCSCHGGGGVFVLLYKLHIAMPSVLATLRQFRFYPIFLGQGILDGIAHEAVEFNQCQSRFTIHISYFSPLTSAFPIIYARQKLGMP